MKTFSTLLLLCLFIEISTAQTVNTFPYVQDFNQQTPCGTNSGDPCVLSIDWQNSLNDDVDWTAYNASTPTTDTGPTEDHTDGNGGTFLYIESSTNGTGYPFKVALLESPYFDFTNVAAPRLSFWHHLYGSSMGHIFVDARIGSNGTWTTVLDSLTGNQNLWNETEIALNSFALSDSVQIRFRGETGNNFFSDMAIDDIEVFAAAPYDLMPIASTGLPSSNCQLGTYNINVDLYNNGAFAITSGNMISILFESGSQSFSEDFTLATDWQSGDTLNFSLSTNIDLSTTGIYTPTIISYYINDTSTAFNDTLHLGTIEHLPFIQQYPYFESFEDGANGWRAINDQNGAENGSWAWGVPNKRFIDHAPDGDNAWVTGGLDNAPYNSNEDSWILSPCFDFSTLCAPRMDFQIWWQTEYQWDGLVLESSIDGGMTWQLVGNVNDPTNWFNTTNISAAPAGQPIGWSGGGVVSPNGSNGWVLAVHELDNLAGNAQVQFRFSFASDGVYEDDGIGLDAIHVYDIVDLTDSLALCSMNDTALLIANALPSDNLLWSTGDITDSITVTNAGTYTLTVTRGACSTTDSIVVIQSPTVSVDLGLDSVFACGQYSLDAGAGFTEYNWSNGNTQAAFTTTFNGTYYVTVTNNFGCTAEDSILVEIGLAPFINLGIDSSDCDSFQIISGGGFDTYLWSDNSTTEDLWVTTTGDYGLTVTDAQGCTASDTIFIEIFAQPVLTQDSIVFTLGQSTDFTLQSANNFDTYLWSTGETTSSITIDTSNGVFANYYTLTVTDGNGCSFTDSIFVTLDEVITVDYLNTPPTLLIYPNPTHDYLYIQNSNTISVVDWQITDINGRIVSHGQSTEGNNKLTNISELNSGIYFIQLFLENRTHVQKIVKL